MVMFLDSRELFSAVAHHEIGDDMNLVDDEGM